MPQATPLKKATQIRRTGKKNGGLLSEGGGGGGFKSHPQAGKSSGSNPTETHCNPQSRRSCS